MASASSAKTIFSKTKKKLTFNEVSLFRKWHLFWKKETLSIQIFNQLKEVFSGWFRAWSPITKESKGVSLFSKTQSFSKTERSTLWWRWTKNFVWLPREIKKNSICRQFSSIFKMPSLRIKRTIEESLSKNMETMCSMMWINKIIKLKWNRFKMSWV